MRNLPVMAMISGMLVTCAAGGEVIESLKTRDGREYTKVEILGSDSLGVKIRHEAGTARIPILSLPDELQEKYRFDFKKAEAQKAREAGQLRQHGESAADGGKSTVPSTSATPVKRAAAPSETGKTPAESSLPEPVPAGMKAEEMPAYVATLATRISLAEGEIRMLSKMEEEQRARVRVVNRVGAYRAEVAPDKAGQAKARKLQIEIEALERRVEMARSLIADTSERYHRLTGKTLPVPGQAR